MDPASKFSLEWWKGRHEAPEGYFPRMSQHWDWRVYDAMPDWFAAFAEPTPEDDALEVGCGYGQWMVPCAPLVRTVYGIDIHPSLVEKADEKLAGVPNAAMFLSDGLTIPFEDRSFSLVYSISVFQHIPRAIVRGYFAEMARVLRPGGRAVLHFRGADGDGPYSDDIVENHTGDFSVGWTLEEARAEAEAVGWRITRSAFGQSLIVRAEPA
jgi:SAM-dependent methyltransferase